MSFGEDTDIEAGLDNEDTGFGGMDENSSEISELAEALDRSMDGENIEFEDHRPVLPAREGDDKSSGQKDPVNDSLEEERNTQQVSKGAQEQSKDQIANPQSPSKPEPPSDWDRSAKDLFHSAPTGNPAQLQQWIVGMQDQVAKREKQRNDDYQRKTVELGESRRYYEGLDRVIKPHIPGIMARGTTPEVFISQMMDVDRRLRENPEAGVNYLANKLGLRQRRPANGTGQSQGTGSNGAGGSAASSQFNQPGQVVNDPRVERLEAGFRNIAAREEKRLSDRWSTAADAIRVAKNEDGTDQYPHLAEVEQSMCQIIQGSARRNPDADPKEVYSKAYEIACWNNPAVREKLINEQVTSRAGQNKAEIERHRRAARSLGTGEVPGIAEAEVPESAEDTIRMVLAGKLK